MLYRGTALGEVTVVRKTLDFFQSLVVAAVVATAVLIAGATGIYLGLKSVVEIPVVEVSYSTGNIVRLCTKDGCIHSPQTLPEKYDRVWVR